MLAGRRILLGVSGGIAAYKAVYLARRLIEAGAEVRTIMTDGAAAFVGEQSFAAVTGHRVYRRLFGDPLVSPHTELARWADVIVIAPATANTLARLANGQSGDLLAATVLAARVPVAVAPAMHTEMWEHPATLRNVERLSGDGVHVLPPVEGALAGGDVGAGRMLEPEAIVAALEGLMVGQARMAGWTVLVTAGGTREPIDPVRYIGNRSSGKMGHAIADEAARRGARVVLVTSAQLAGPAGAEVVEVATAQEMADAVWSRADQVDVAVMAAAVADFRPKAPQDTKLRRADGIPEVLLEPTPDVLAGVASMANRPYLVGFAAETGSVEGAIDKARRKGVDILVANDVTESGSGFGTDTNRVSVIRPDGHTDAWPKMTKQEVAGRLWDLVIAERGDGSSRV